MNGSVKENKYCAEILLIILGKLTKTAVIWKTNKKVTDFK